MHAKNAQDARKRMRRMHAMLAMLEQKDASTTGGDAPAQRVCSSLAGHRIQRETERGRSRAKQTASNKPGMAQAGLQEGTPTYMYLRTGRVWHTHRSDKLIKARTYTLDNITYRGGGSCWL